MADNGRWFKLWCQALGDPDLDALDVADFGRWAKFGAYLKEHGEGGRIILKSPAKALCAYLQIETFDALFNVMQKFPNVDVSLETNTTVSLVVVWRNWQKYQGDLSTSRVHKFRTKKRQSETPKRRGEERRREEKKNIPPNPPKGGFDDFWQKYPKKKAKQAAIGAWNKLSPDDTLAGKILDFLEKAPKSKDWQKDNGQFIPHPASFLNGRRWEDELTFEKDWRNSLD